MTALLPTYARTDLVFESGQGAYLTTVSGERYLDFASGVAVTVLGHAHPHLIKALCEQAEKVWHTSNLFRIAGQERLADRLTAETFADRVFFTNSGAEAVECAIKAVRKYFSFNDQPDRYRLITFEGAFHGRTLATIAAGRQEKHLDGFGPVVDGFDQVPLGDIDAVEAAIGEQTAGFLIEPLQGEGGIRGGDWAFLRELRALADRHELLLVFDEVQTGVGRTGKLFAYEWSGIEPDIMAVAKGIGGGFPFGACLLTEIASKGMIAGTHGSTFGGNPLAMAVGNAVLDIVLKPSFLDNVQQMSLLLRQRLARIADEHPDVIEDVRGEGLLIGLKCRVPQQQVIGALMDEHLLAVAAGENVVRLMPPLIIGEAEIEEAINSISAACAALRTPAPSQV